MQDYILPAEYVNTMRDYMLDKCPVSTYKDIAQVIQEDLGKSPEELFASIEEVPIASASLAQVMGAPTSSLPNGDVVPPRLHYMKAVALISCRRAWTLRLCQGTKDRLARTNPPCMYTLS